MPTRSFSLMNATVAGLTAVDSEAPIGFLSRPGSTNPAVTGNGTTTLNF
jgi:hypothetical protein